MTADRAARPSPRPTSDPAAPTFVSYGDFGYRFFEAAVTKARIDKATAGLAGRTIEFGPSGVGPMGLVKVRAEGSVRRPSIERRDHPEHVAYQLTIPVDLHLTIEIGLDKNRFRAGVIVRLALAARAAEPLLIVIDIADPTRDDVEVDLRADGMRASVLKAVAGIEGEIKRTVAKVVKRELDAPGIRKARVIDVGAALEALEV